MDCLLWALLLVQLLSSFAQNNQFLNVHIIPHSHQDIGWINTYEYFRSVVSPQVQRGVYEALTKPNTSIVRKFNYAEMVFHSEWLKHQPSNVQATVKSLFESGRLGICEGGWAQPDEATTHYQSVINMMTVGHLWLNRTYQYVPSFGWQMDPFGGSGYIPYLWSEFGFTTNVRSSQRVGMHTQGAMGGVGQTWQYYTHWHFAQHEQYMWESAFTGHSVFEHLWSIAYNEMPVEFMFEDTGTPVTPSTIDKMANDLMTFVRSQYVFYLPSTKTNDTAVIWGKDWSFFNATYMFDNMDQILIYINKHPQEFNANIQYSTWEDFSTGMFRNNITYPQFVGDTLPLTDNCCNEQAAIPPSLWNCWTGFYTSRPVTKYMVRYLDHALRAAEIAYVHAMGVVGSLRGAAVFPQPPEFYENNLAHAHHVQGILQHHDAVTGTSAGNVDSDWVMNAWVGVGNATNVLVDSIALSLLINATGSDSSSSSSSSSPSTSQIKQQHTNNNNNNHKRDTPFASPSGPQLRYYEPNNAIADAVYVSFPAWTPVVVHNSLAFNRTQVVELYINVTASDFVPIMVADSNSVMVPFALLPVINNVMDCMSVLRDPEDEGEEQYLRQMNFDYELCNSINAKQQKLKQSQSSPSGTADASEALLTFRLFFLAQVPALGSTVYFIIENSTAATANPDLDPSSSFSSSHHFKQSSYFTHMQTTFAGVSSPEADTSISNDQMTVFLSQGGMVDRIQLKASGEMIHIGQQYMTYCGSPDNSDAYVMDPLGPAVSVYDIAQPCNFGGMDEELEASRFIPHPHAPLSQTKPYMPYVFSRQNISAHSERRRIKPETHDDLHKHTLHMFLFVTPVVQEVVTVIGNIATQSIRIFSTSFPQAQHVEKITEQHVEKVPTSSSTPKRPTTTKPSSSKPSSGALSTAVMVDQIVEIRTVIQPINTNAELIMRFSSDIVNGRVLNSDEGGLSIKTSNWNQYFSFPQWNPEIGCNYHPATTMAWIEDQRGGNHGSSHRLELLFPFSRGVASLDNGQLEFILQRTGCCGQQGPGVQDNIPVNNMVWLIVGETTNLNVVTPRLNLLNNHPLLLLVGNQINSPMAWLDVYAGYTSALAPNRVFPDNVHLLTLAPLQTRFVHSSAPPPSSFGEENDEGSIDASEGAYSLRVQHIYNDDTFYTKQDAHLGLNTTVDLREMFTSFAVRALNERTLSLAMAVDDVSTQVVYIQSHTAVEGVELPTRDHRQTVLNESVPLIPFQIRSFLFDVHPRLV